MAESTHTPAGSNPAAAHARLEVITGDITRSDVDAIVNAANEALAGGGGVDGAIHAAAGRELLDACLALPEVAPGVRCPTGEARITPGFRLRARHVIHTVGPVWCGGQQGEPALLASCYRRSIELAREHGLATLAFPAISTGIFGYPLEAACRVAVDSLLDALDAAPSIVAVELVAFSEPTARALRQALAASSSHAERASHHGGQSEVEAPLGADAAPVEVVHAWLAASNAADADRLIALTAPGVEIKGPRGIQHGRDILRAWLERAAARFVTQRVFSAGERVVVEQLGLWNAPDGQGRAEAKVASRFVVRAGQVHFLERHDSLEEALALAGISAANERVEHGSDDPFGATERNDRRPAPR